jgi:hypothetical protein
MLVGSLSKSEQLLACFLTASKVALASGPGKPWASSCTPADTSWPTVDRPPARDARLLAMDAAASLLATTSTLACVGRPKEEPTAQLKDGRCKDT